jgi:hypothetical protein
MARAFFLISFVLPLELTGTSTFTYVQSLFLGAVYHGQVAVSGYVCHNMPLFQGPLRAGEAAMTKF